MQSQILPGGLASITSAVRAGIGRLASISRGRVWRREPRRLRLCETITVGNRGGYLAVVRYERQHFLIGGTNTSIAMLAQLTGAGEVARADAEAIEDELESRNTETRA